jgi:hypothetical protein
MHELLAPVPPPEAIAKMTAIEGVRAVPTVLGTLRTAELMERLARA